MATPSITIYNRSSSPLAETRLDELAQALQTQVDRDLGPVWGVTALISTCRPERADARSWHLIVVDRPRLGLGVHVDGRGRPFAEVQACEDWTLAASHALLEMLVDPRGARFMLARPFAPGSERRAVRY